MHLLRTLIAAVHQAHRAWRLFAKTQSPIRAPRPVRDHTTVHIAVADILAERINSGDGTEFGWRDEFLFSENLGGVILLDRLTARI